MSVIKPLVSIVIPVYNGSNYLREAIESALGQSYENIEVLVINDGSDDDGKSAEIAKSYGDRIRYFCKDNGGVASALNLGIREMRGKYFSWLSHDDVYYPHKIENQIEFLKTMRADVILYSNFEYVDKNSEYISNYWVEIFDPKYFLYYLATEGPVHGCTLLIPRKCFDDVGLFNEDLVTTQDYEMWFRIGLKYRFIHLDDVLIKSRIHEEQGSITLKSYTDEREKLHISFLDYIIKNNIPTPDLAPTFLVKASYVLKRKGLSRASQYSLRLAIELAVKEYLNLENVKFIILAVILKIKRKLCS